MIATLSPVIGVMETVPPTAAPVALSTPSQATTCDDPSTAQILYRLCACAYNEFPANFLGFGWMQGSTTETCSAACGSSPCMAAYNIFFNHNGVPAEVSSDDVFLVPFYCQAQDTFLAPPSKCSNEDYRIPSLETSNDFEQFQRWFAGLDQSGSDHTVFNLCTNATLQNSTSTVAGCTIGPCLSDDWDVSTAGALPRSILNFTTRGFIPTTETAMPPDITSRINDRSREAVGEYTLCECSQPIDSSYYFQGSMFIQATPPQSDPLNLNYFNLNFNSSIEVNSQKPRGVHCVENSCTVQHVTFRPTPREWHAPLESGTTPHPFIWLGSTIVGPVGVQIPGPDGQNNTVLLNQDTFDRDYNVRIPSRTQCANEPGCTVVPTVVGVIDTCVWACVDMDIPVLFEKNFSEFALPRIRRHNVSSLSSCNHDGVPEKRVVVNTAWLPWLYNILSLEGNEYFVPWRDGSIERLQSVAPEFSTIRPEYGCSGVVSTSEPRVLQKNTRVQFITGLDGTVPCDNFSVSDAVMNTVNDDPRLFPIIDVTHTLSEGSDTYTDSDFEYWLKTVYTKYLYSISRPYTVVCNATHDVKFTLTSQPPSEPAPDWSTCDPSRCTSRVHPDACYEFRAEENCSSIPLCEPCRRSVSTTTTLVVPTITYPPIPQPHSVAKQNEIDTAVTVVSVLAVVAFIGLLVSARMMYKRRHGGGSRGDDYEEEPLLSLP